MEKKVRYHPISLTMVIIWKLKKKKKMFAFKTKKTYEEESIQNNAFLFKLSTPIKDY